LQTFKKEERLFEKKIIKELFEKGLNFYIAPFKVIYTRSDFESKYPAKAMVAVSCRNFKKAVDRNHIKRMMREAYRKNKEILYDALKDSPKKMVFSLIFIGKIKIPYKEIESKIILILQRLVKENEKSAK
jgi:ribonuclease P protein component